MCFVQVKIVKADIPEEYLGKVMLRTNEAMDKYQIEKVGSLYHPPTPHHFVTSLRATCGGTRYVLFVPCSLHSSIPCLRHDFPTALRTWRRT